MRQNAPVTEVLKQRAEAVRTGAELLMAKTRDWQVIRKYLSNRENDIVLTDEQQAKLQRYQFIYNQLAGGKYSKPEVINTVMKVYGVEQRQVYEDIAHTQEIFSTVTSINKLFELQIQLELAKEMKRKCLEVSDIKTAAIVDKNITAILAMLPDEDSAPGEDFEGHIIEASFDPALLGAPAIDMMEVLRVVNDKRKVPINMDMFEILEIDDKEAATL